RHQQAHRQAAEGRGDRRVAEEPHLHARSDLVVAAGVRRPCRGRRSARQGRPQVAGDLRPDPGERGAEGQGPSGGQGADMTSQASVSTSSSVPAAPPEPLAAINVREASKAYGHVRDAVLALDRLELSVRAGELVCLVGASGCGKSTLLNLLAGLDQPSAGSVDVRGRTALMFQEAALFPWLTVAGNVELALRL